MYFHKIPLDLLLIFLTLATISHHSNAQDSSPTDFRNTHNTARASLNVPGLGAMVLNTTLTAYAQNYANARMGDCSLIASGGPYGENLAKGAGLTGINAVNLWVSESPYYTYATNTCATGKVCSHYTQVVWANSGQLGCARVLCNNGVMNFIVCTYSAKGNVAGELPY